MWVLGDDNKLTKQKQASDPLKTTYSQEAGGCAVAYALKAAYYEIRYKPVIDKRAANSEQYGYEIVAASVDVVL